MNDDDRLVRLTDGPAHSRAIAARREVVRRGGTPGGGYAVSPDLATVDPVAMLLASITPRLFEDGPPPGLGAPGVEVTRWACPTCGRLGWLARHPDDPPVSGLCPRCSDDGTAPAPPPAPAPPTPAPPPPRPRMTTPARPHRRRQGR